MQVENHIHVRRYVRLLVVIAMCLLMADGVSAQQEAPVAAAAKTKTVDEAKTSAVQMTDSLAVVSDSAASEALDEAAAEMSDTTAIDAMQEGGLYTTLKDKFIDGGVLFMSIIAIILIVGLACCIERIMYLSLSEIDAKKFMRQLEQTLTTKGREAALTQCRETRGPVASICYQGVLHMGETMESIERSVNAYAAVQTGNMEKGTSWITLFIAMAPSLGFLGTVIGMVMSFDQIEMAGDISPTIVAGGMKVALITTIFGIITALILQLFYNYILSKIDHLTAQMEESAITLMDILKEQADTTKE